MHSFPFEDSLHNGEHYRDPTPYQALRERPINYANRGMDFEGLVKAQNGWYRNQGIGRIDKQNTHFLPIRDARGKIVTAKVDEKATVDFVGRYRGYPIAFDAKECGKDVIELKRLEPNQVDFLEDWTRDGCGIGFVAVLFRWEIGYIVPWFFWRAAMAARCTGNSGAPVSAMGMTWTPTGKASIRRDEMAPQWAVPVGGRGGFDYIATARRLWGLQ